MGVNSLLKTVTGQRRDCDLQFAVHEVNWPELVDSVSD